MIRKSKIVGVSFGDRQENVRSIVPGFVLFWRHEVENPYDENAVAVFVDPSMRMQVGHLKRELAKEFMGWVVENRNPRIIAEQVTGGKEKQSYGVNVRIVCEDV